MLVLLAKLLRKPINGLYRLADNFFSNLSTSKYRYGKYQYRYCFSEFTSINSINGWYNILSQELAFSIITNDTLIMASVCLGIGNLYLVSEYKYNNLFVNITLSISIIALAYTYSCPKGDSNLGSMTLFYLTLKSLINPLSHHGWI